MLPFGALAGLAVNHTASRHVRASAEAFLLAAELFCSAERRRG